MQKRIIIDYSNLLLWFLMTIRVYKIKNACRNLLRKTSDVRHLNYFSICKKWKLWQRKFASICSNFACNKIIQNAYINSFTKCTKVLNLFEYKGRYKSPRIILPFNMTLRCWWSISTGQGRHHDEFSKSRGLLVAQLRAWASSERENISRPFTSTNETDTST